MEKSLEVLEDWEDWNPESGTPFFAHALAGSLAGAAEHCAMFPFDTIKTYSQAANSDGNVLRSLIKGPGEHGEGRGGKVRVNPFGVLRLWRGVSTMLTACIPAHAAYFSIFEHSKVALGVNHSEHTPVAAAMCGIMATVAHDAIMTPMDVIKQRLQLGFHSGPMDCARTLVRTEGFRALYLSFPTTLFMNIPYAGIMVSTNESAKQILNPKNEYNIGAFLASGAIAGGVAAALTNPLDVVKTRLQTQNLLQTYPNCSNAGIDGVVPKTGGPITSSVSNMKARAGVFENMKWTTPKMNLNYGVRYTYTLNSAFSGKCLSFPYQYSPSSSYKRKVTTTLSNQGSMAGQRSHFFAGPSRKSRTVVELDCLCKEIPVEGGKASPGGQMRYNGFLQTVKRIYSEEGYRGFARGLRPRLMVHAPSVAISWTTYETAKQALLSLS